MLETSLGHCCGNVIEKETVKVYVKERVERHFAHWRRRNGELEHETVDDGSLQDS